MKILTVISLLAAVLSTHLDCLAVSGLFPLPTNGCPYKAPCYNDRYEFVDIKQFQSQKRILATGIQTYIIIHGDTIIF